MHQDGKTVLQKRQLCWALEGGPRAHWAGGPRTCPGGAGNAGPSPRNIFLVSVSSPMGLKLWEDRGLCFFSVTGMTPGMAPGLEQTRE